MKKEIIITRDGSHSIAVPEMNVMYHSVHGAIQEAQHVFIEAGLNYLINQSTNQPLHIFEMGFGTGLNAFLTAIKAEEASVKINYTAIETSPLSLEEARPLNYAEILGHAQLFQQLHQCGWNKDVALNDFFTLKKLQADLINFSTNQLCNLIYYDAFAPSAQPELWTKEVFVKLFALLEPNGILITYCAKGDVRRAMMAAGFTVKKMPGPPGKREILRGMKP